MSYAKDMDRMLELVFRDHGGCDEPDCSLRIALEDEYNPEEAIWLWACSGAACAEFNALMDKHEKRFKREREKSA